MLLTFSATARTRFSYRLLGPQRQLQSPVSRFSCSAVAQIPQQHLPKALLPVACLAPFFILTVSRWQPHITKLTSLQIPSPFQCFFSVLSQHLFYISCPTFSCSTNPMEPLRFSHADYLIHVPSEPVLTSGDSEGLELPAPLIYSGACKDEHTLRQS